MSEAYIKEHSPHVERYMNTRTWIEEERSSTGKIRILDTFSFWLRAREFADLKKVLKGQIDRIPL